MDTLISVIIPSFNHAHLIGRALQSLQEQTYQNWEALVVDNHSEDNTGLVVNSFNDPRIRIIKVVNNGIIAVSRNTGIRNAKGEWVALLDSDDWWLSNKLEECAKYFSSFEVIFHDLKIIGNKKGPFYKNKISGRDLVKPILVDLLINGSPIANSSVIVRRKLILEVGISESKEMIASEDYNTWLRIADVTNKFKYIPKSLGYYLIHSHGISQRDMSVPMKRAVTEFTHRLTQYENKRLLALIEYTHGRYCFLHSKFKEANESLLFSLKYGNLEIRLKSGVMLAQMTLRSK